MMKWYLLNSVCLGISGIVLFLAESVNASRLERLVAAVVMLFFFVFEIGFTIYFLLTKVD